MEQDSLGAIGSEEFSTPPEILTKEAHSLMACSPEDCADVHVVASAKQEEGIFFILHVKGSRSRFFFLIAQVTCFPFVPVDSMGSE